MPFEPAHFQALIKKHDLVVGGERTSTIKEFDFVAVEFDMAIRFSKL